MVEEILVISIAVQLAAGVVALSLIRLTGRVYSWLFLASGMVIMGSRRLFALMAIIRGNDTGDATIEGIGLVISILMLIGVILISSFFRTHKRNQIELYKSREELKKLLEAADGFAIIRTDNHPENPVVAEFSPGAEEMFGYSSKEIEGMPFSTLVAEEKRKDLDMISVSMAETGERFTGELNMLRKSGESFPAVFSAYPLVDENGAITESLSIGVDLSRQREIEDALRNRDREYRTLIDNLQGFVYRCSNDRNWTMSYISNGCSEITGYTPDEIIDNRVIAYNQIIVEEFRDRVWDSWQKKLESKSSYEEEYQITAKNNKIKWLWERGCGVFSETTGELLFLEGFVTDVTQRKVAITELRKMERIGSLGTLAGGIAHDFNNILMGVFGNISMAKEKIHSAHPVAGYLNEAETSLGRAKRLTRQLLTFAKGGDPVVEVVDLGRLVEEIVRFDLSGSNVQSVFTIPDRVWKAKVDKGQIQQVFSNLVINADQAMPKGGSLGICLENIDTEQSDHTSSKLLPGKYIKISVRDSGTGIRSDYISRIFDPYFSTKHEGRGLGLATVYSIISKHGGCIEVDSRPGTGSLFSVFIPASPDEETEENHDGSVSIGTAVKAGGRILVMDDEETVRKVTSEMLVHLGHTVAEASTGEEAVEMYRRGLAEGAPFDLLIMDLTIPGGMGGEKAVEQVLEIDSEARAIVSSGYAESPIMANYDKYGFKGIIAKPYTINTLKTVLDRVLHS